MHLLVGSDVCLRELIGWEFMLPVLRKGASFAVPMTRLWFRLQLSPAFVS